jgi:hypothetical protein
MVASSIPTERSRTVLWESVKLVVEVGINRAGAPHFSRVKQHRPIGKCTPIPALRGDTCGYFKILFSWCQAIDIDRESLRNTPARSRSEGI